MSRYINIPNTNTRVGYDFLKSQYFVTNMYSVDNENISYTTYRTTISEIQNVLSSLGITTITDSQLQNLKDTLEVLTSISYTWEDTGAYIKTIQFNDYKDYPLVIDCEKAKFFIKDTNIVYDLTVNESPTVVRIPYLCSYYKTKIGLDVSTNDMLYFYNLLISFYKPNSYNVIETLEDNTFKYSNICKSSNFNNESLVQYTATHNPFNSITGFTGCKLLIADSVLNTILAYGTSEYDNLWSAGDTLVIENTEVIVNMQKYSADGDYTVVSVSRLSDYLLSIEVDGNIPVSYEFPLYSCNLIVESQEIDEINRDANSIILTHQVANTIFVGDTININGTTITTDYEDITCDGQYTIMAIDNKTITVEETLPTNFSGNGATITKEAFLGNVRKILVTNQKSHVYLFSDSEYTISQNDSIAVRNSDEKLVNNFGTIQSYDSSTYEITLTTSTLETYEPVFPDALKPTYADYTLINTSESSLESMPTGEFMVNTFAEAKNYISLGGSGVPQLSDNIENNFNKNVPTTYSISTEAGITSMSLLGLYSQIYSEL